MIPISENPAVVDPVRTLNANQRDAISSIAFFRHQRVDGSSWAIGPKRFSKRTIDALERWELVREERGRGLSLTTGGKLVVDKLKGKSHGSA